MFKLSRDYCRASVIAGLCCVMCMSAGLGMASRMDYEVMERQIRHNRVSIDRFGNSVSK